MTPPHRLMIGVDPGYQGGAIVLVSSSMGVMAGLNWSIRRRKAGNIWIVNMIGRDESIEVASLHAVASMMKPEIRLWSRTQMHDIEPRGTPPRLCCEDLFGRGRTLQRLAESAGELVGCLRSVTAPVVIRCHASTWRSAVLQLPGGSRRERCDTAAMKYAKSEMRLDGALRNCGHAADAACIAAYGLRVTNAAGVE